MQIFSAGRTDGTKGTNQPKVVQEVLADLKICNMNLSVLETPPAPKEHTCAKQSGPLGRSWPLAEGGAHTLKCIIYIYSKYIYVDCLLYNEHIYIFCIIYIYFVCLMNIHAYIVCVYTKQGFI